MRKTLGFVLSIVLLVVLSGSCLAQTETATLSGRVIDPSGAVIPGAEVVLTNMDTNIAQTVKANDEGLYVFTSVRPGKYRVAAGATGFKSLIKENLILHVQDEIAENFSLAVGSVTESVTVTADQLNINTQDATVSTVVDRNFVSNMPLNGRSFQTLLQLTPGVVATPAAYSTQGQFSINGQRADTNYFTMDGASANNGCAAGFGLVQSGGGALPGLTALGSTQSLVSADAMEEFRVETSTYAPEFGRTPGGQISILSRSGSNNWHGSLFEYLRNDVLDANNWFGDRSALPKPKERQNDFGGTVGGPVIKDKTFFFFSYEGLRLRKPQTATTLVPSNAAKGPPHNKLNNLVICSILLL
jgi:hypothetical protein